MTPTTESSMKIEASSLGAVLAVPALNVTQPKTDGIDSCSKHTNRDASDNENKPDMARIEQSPRITDQSGCICVENAESLAFLGVFIDPVNSRQILVSDSSPRSLHIPIQRCPFFVFCPVAAAGCPHMSKAGVRAVARGLFSQFVGPDVQKARGRRQRPASIR